MDLIKRKEAEQRRQAEREKWEQSVLRRGMTPYPDFGNNRIYTPTREVTPPPRYYRSRSGTRRRFEDQPTTSSSVVPEEITIDDEDDVARSNEREEEEEGQRRHEQELFQRSGMTAYPTAGIESPVRRSTPPPRRKPSQTVPGDRVIGRMERDESDELIRQRNRSRSRSFQGLFAQPTSSSSKAAESPKLFEKTTTSSSSNVPNVAQPTMFTSKRKRSRKLIEKETAASSSKVLDVITMDDDDNIISSNWLVPKISYVEPEKKYIDKFVAIKQLYEQFGNRVIAANCPLQKGPPPAEPTITILVGGAECNSYRTGVGLFAQELWMILRYLHAKKIVGFKIIKVDANIFDDTFSPAIMFDEETNTMHCTADGILEQLQAKTGESQITLFAKDPSTEQMIVDVFDKFKLSVWRHALHDKDNGKKEPSRFEELPENIKTLYEEYSEQVTKLDEFLSRKRSRYLLGDEPCVLDYRLMARLHHIKVAGFGLLRLVIPHKHINIWRYISEAYKYENFRDTCPANEDIVHSYSKKMGFLEKATVSLEMPPGVMEKLKKR